MTAASASAQPLLRVRGLSIDVETRRGPARVVNDVSFNVGRGEALAIVGESGCGKSLTMLGLMGLLSASARVTEGQVLFGDRDLLKLAPPALRKVRGADIGMIFQDPMRALNPVLRIGQQLAEPLIYHRGQSNREAWERSAELLALVGVSGGAARLRSYPHELSGGMRQRVMIAMAIACSPSLLIADEPTTALDVTTQAQVVRLVKDLQQRLGLSLIWITHDLGLAAGVADRMLVLYSGRVVEDGRVDDLYAHPSHPYTRGLLACLPQVNAGPRRRLPAIAGTPPEPGRGPKGCQFFLRCPERLEQCAAVEPELRRHARDEEDHHVSCWAVADGTGA